MSRMTHVCTAARSMDGVGFREDVKYVNWPPVPADRRYGVIRERVSVVVSCT